MSSFEPFRIEDTSNPYPAYRELRDHAPVHWAPESGVWCVSRFEDVATVLRSADDYSSRAMFTMLMNNGKEGAPPLNWSAIKFVVRMALQARMNPFAFATARNLIAEDGESHTAMRNIVNRGFTPRRIASWEKRAKEIVASCMERLHRGDSFDVMRDLAIPLPVTLIAEMLGVEPERQVDFKRWSDAVVHYATGPGRATPFAKPFADAMIGVTKYLSRIASERRAQPTDDLVSALVAQQDGGAGLSDREVVQFAVLLLVAGNETTTNLIGNTVSALLDHPDVLERAAADPSLIPAVIEEGLRYDAPVQLVFRSTTRDVELSGTAIPAGSFVAPLIGSANRDERQFPDPDRFDLDRDTRGHLGFGFGKHFCLGSSLARLEARAALEALLPELPALKRAPEQGDRVESFLVRGIQSLALQRSSS
jgi:cytochrome P450